jgi:hypothetical protein
MARYERDPGRRRRLAILLAVIEVLVVSGNFFTIFTAYLNWLNVRFSLSTFLGAHGMGVSAVVTAVFLVACAVVGVLYVKGDSRARIVLVAANALLVLLGLLWFLKGYALSAEPNRNVAFLGLLLPMVTLFPLLWPLISFRPVPPAAGQ